MGCEQRRVSGEHSRIACEVFLRAKLCRVHEDRDHDDVAFTGRPGHQACMAGVQRSHRGHKSHSLTRGPRLVNERPHVIGIVDDLLHHAIASTAATASCTARPRSPASIVTTARGIMVEAGSWWRRTLVIRFCKRRSLATESFASAQTAVPD